MAASCTYTHTKKKHQIQYWRRCLDCHNPNQGVCLSCCECCHKGHNLGPLVHSNFYCDCPSTQKCTLCITKPPVPPITEKINTGINSAAVQLFDAFGSNKVFSPLSIAIALSLVHHGARNETENELTKFFGTKYHMPDLLKIFANFNIPVVKVANVLYINQNVVHAINTDYLTSIKPLAMCRSENFKLENEIRETINTFIETNTNGLIKNPITPGSIPSNAVMVLINTVYFKCSWLKPFKKEHTKLDIDFTSELDGKVSKVPMMHKTAHFNYYHTPTYHMLEMPYEDEDFAMGLVLSRDASVNPSQQIYLDVLSNFKYHTDKLTSTKVELFMPRFTHRTKIGLVPHFKKLGVNTLFDQYASDLSGILPSAGEAAFKLYISNAIHEAVVIVDEEGTEAAAFTAMTVSAACVQPDPPMFRCDRSFMYYIRHKPSNIILFVGDYHGN